MNWDALAAIGEIVGAAAVVFSLGYLAVQIRIQNAESRSAAMHEISVGWRAASEVFTDRELAEIFVKANEEFDSLSNVESLRFIAGVHAIFRVFEEAFHQNRLNRLDKNIWEAMNRQYSSYMASPAFRKYWKLRGDHYNQEFRDYVAQLEPTSWDLK
jgi:hypothetical protein